jgi:hypothetical protein
MRHLAAVEVVSRNDSGATRRILVGRTICRIVTALDTGTKISGLDKLDVVLVSKANASLRVPLSTNSTARIVLATRIFGVQTSKVARPDAAGELGKTTPFLALASLEGNVAPKVWR